MLDPTAPPVDLDRKLNDAFPGRVVRKDLTQRLKEGANVPVYVLEYLLGTYCATDDELAIQEGVARVKKILADNYVRPDEAERVKSRIREQGRFTVIDRVTVTLNDKQDRYEALLMNLGVKDIVVDSSYVTNFEKLLGGGIWCILSLEYDASQKPSPFVLASLKPVQMPSLDLEEVFEGRKAFTLDEWIDVLLRSTGLEPTTLSADAKWHLIARMVPLIENNYNSCELGPRSTGKSHIYKEISPNTILVSGGQTTVANLFYNMSRQQVGLVGLWDVVAFDEVAGISSKQGKKSVGLLYLDLSRFKAVNDTLGHVAGDQLLQAIGTRLIKLVRPQDTVARVGGDEFVIVFPEVGPKEAALALAKRVQDGMGDAFEINGKILHIGSNIGLALYPENASDRDDLIYKADIAHYKTKQKSVGLGLYEGERPRYTAAELQLEEDLRAALAGEQLRLHYQPVAQLKDGQVVGVEALVRWCHPTKGFITPLDFIPLAEETGLIRDIDRWVLNEAVKQNACWAAQGIRLEVAVNVSPKSFSDSRFLDHLTQTLCTHSLDPSCLVLEITERLLVDVTNAQAALRQINTLGVKVALDDFGIGFSSLAYLENLPIDLLKVDRHFVKGINTAPASEAIIRTVISLAHNLGMEVVAEGIESEAQRLWLLQEGCDKAQGYLLGKPLPADKFLHSWYQLNTKAKAKNLQDRVLS